MRKTLIGMLAGTALAGLAGAAMAEDRAVVIGNADYAQLPDVDGLDLGPASAALKRNGFRVVEGPNLGIADIRFAIADLLRPDATPGRRVVVLAGHFVHADGETWLLGREAGTETLASVDAVGVRLSTVLALMRGGAANSVLLLATDTDDFAVGAGLARGRAGRIESPDVSVLVGFAPGISRAAEVLASPRGTLQTALAQGPSVKLVNQARAPGARSPVVVAPTGGAPVVVPAPAGGPVVVPPPGRVDDLVQPGPDEMAAWTNAKRTGSAAAYREFLGKYPNSIFAGAARGRMAEAEAAARPADPAATAEAALRLSRAQRAQVQRQLSLLTFETNGIDGSFGEGTRSAIRAFQRNSGLPATGYLTRAQLDLLARNADARQRALDAESDARRAAQEDADNAYWREMQKSAGFGAWQYLSRYPDGLHADEARRQVIGEPRRDAGADARAAAETRRADDAAWAAAQAGGALPGYRTYLEKFPQGRHAAEARKAVADRMARIAADERDEAALDLSPPIRMAVQARLAQLGLLAGRADGNFGPETRAALRRYQQSRNLRVTGYLNQSTMVRLLSGTLLGQD